MGEDGPEVGRGERLYVLFTPAPTSYFESHMNKSVGEKKKEQVIGGPSNLFPPLPWVGGQECVHTGNVGVKTVCVSPLPSVIPYLMFCVLST